MKQKYDFISKAQTLKFLSDKITTAKVLPLEIVRYDEWHNDSQKILDRLQNLPTERLIIRSSSKGEDTIDSSNAGRFLTVLHVDKNCLDDIRHSIEQVFSSYETNSVDDEVLVQPMLKDLTRSGVVFTSDIDTLAPYYIINYDEGDHSDTVTGGTTNSLKTHIVFRDSPAETGNKYIDSLVKTCKELEDIFNNSHLDVEFGFNKNNELYIFQVRPIVVSGKKDLARLNLEKPLRKIYKKFMKLSSPHPNLLGKKTIFGVMPDWNPAEIIGFRPKRLALSLYKELVTDNIWAYQRDNYGYRNLRSHPLLVSFLGVPFIDVRVSFNSFIPKELHDSIAEKLCNFYLDKLENIPVYHDKVEFEIVFSCYYLNVSDKLKELLDYGFSENEVKRIEFSLLELTNRIIDPIVGLYKKDLEKISILEKKYDDILNSDLAIVDKIYWLSENCKRYGTLPFAGIARAAFVAVQFLRSFVSLDIITEKEYETFLKSVSTVNKKMNIDLKKLVNKKLSQEDFLKKYGHIRPGTYDILSLRYDENFDGYFNQTAALPEEDITDDFSFSKEQHEKIDKFLIENGIKSNSRDLITFIRESIEGREYSKFVFTKSLSMILKKIEEFGLNNDVFREDLAFLDFQVVKKLYASLNHLDIKEIFMSNINKNKTFYEFTESVKLPSVILNPDDIYHFSLFAEEPNFITLKKITENVVMESDIRKNKKIQNKIVFIKSADPGYDFLFSKDIGGLVTQYGGANSHMAIRCAELGIPAVIGAGEKNFKEWVNAQLLEIDCSNKQVTILK